MAETAGMRILMCALLTMAAMTERSWASRIPVVGSLTALAVLVSGLLVGNALGRS